jgi:hypothetical protein
MVEPGSQFGDDHAAADEIAARADEQRRLVLAGDDRAIYGAWTPNALQGTPGDGWPGPRADVNLTSS